MFSPDSGYKYSPQRMHIAHYKDGKFIAIESKSEYGVRDMHMDWNEKKMERNNWKDTKKFVKGEYYIIAEVDWLVQTVDKSFTLTSY